MSECTKLQKGDYISNSLRRSVSTVFPIMLGGQQARGLVLG